MSASAVRRFSVIPVHHHIMKHGLRTSELQIVQAHENNEPKWNVGADLNKLGTFNNKLLERSVIQ